MGMLSLKDLKPGMVLERPVFTDKGLLLVGEGTALTEKHLYIFKTWGVTQAEVQGVGKEEIDESLLSQLDQQQVEKIETEFRRRFAPYEGDEVMMEICRVAKRLKVRSLLQAIRSTEPAEPAEPAASTEPAT